MYKINRNVKEQVKHVKIINEDRLASFKKEQHLKSWDFVLNTNDANRACDTFLNIFIHMFNNDCPVKTILKKLH